MTRRRQQWLLLLIEEKLGRSSPPSHPVTPLVGSHVSQKVSSIESLSSVKHEDIQALTREIPSGHPAGSARTDNNDVVGVGVVEGLPLFLVWASVGQAGRESISPGRVRGT